MLLIVGYVCTLTHIVLSTPAPRWHERATGIIRIVNYSTLVRRTETRYKFKPFYFYLYILFIGRSENYNVNWTVYNIRYISHLNDIFVRVSSV